MNIEELRDYCLNFPFTTESLPFDDSALVFKVFDKMFALISLEKKWINLKCDPDRSLDLREEYQCLSPGYHMSKKHWNTIYLEELDMSKEMLKELVQHSFDLVSQKLRKAEKEQLREFTSSEK